MPEPILLLLDANSLINRAYFGLLGRQPLTAPDGTPTGALFAFYNMLLKYLDEIKPTHAVAAFDRKEPTFRHRQYDGYKATRKPMPSELAAQIPIMKELLSLTGIPCLELAGYEADDLIGTLAERGKASKMQVIIVSGDKDSLQLADQAVTILLPTTRGGRTETDRYDPAAVFGRYQVNPSQMADLKAIMGDSSDNIPGVRGIGEKGAIELISQFGSLDAVYASLDAIRPPLAAKLRENRDMAYLSRQLSEICREVPLDETLAAFQLLQPDTDRLAGLLARLGFKNILTRLGLVQVGAGAVLAAAAAGAPPEESIHGKMSGRADLLSLLANSSDLIGLCLPDADQLAWQAGEGAAGLLAGDELSEAWHAMAASDWRTAIFDAKAVLHRGISLPDGLKIHDILIAAYLLNQIDGRPDLGRIYERATGTAWPQPDNETNLAGAASGSQEWVQASLFSTQPDQEAPQGVSGQEVVPANPEDQARLWLAQAGLVREAALRQASAIGERGIGFLAYDVEMPLVPILADMEKRGFAIDGEALSELSEEMARRLEVLQDDIYKACGRSFNLHSPKQLAEVLYQHLGLSTGKKSGSGTYSTDSDELDRLAGEHPAIALIIEHRQIAKLRSTYLEGLKKVLDPADGRVHTTFNQALTATGRLSSSEPNLQNIPIRMEAGQKIRRAFVAPPGCLLLDADYSQIELRLLAHLSGDPAMIESFRKSEDIHTNTACRLFGKSPLEITPEMRAIAKTMNFSITYGISDFGLARDLGVSIRQAHELIAEYEAQYPGVKHYLKGLVESAYERGYAETLFGRRRYMPELQSPNRNLRQFGERAAMNMPVQGTAADLIKIAMVAADRGLRQAGLDARLILQVHDELIVEAPQEEADAASRILQEAMNSAAELQVPLVAEVHQGKNWAECK